MQSGRISYQTLRRLPLYKNYLCTLPESTTHVSATQIAVAIGLGDVQVRKDLASVSGQGRPKTGYETRHLLHAVESLLAGGEPMRFCIAGMGHLGTALAQYSGFAEYGLQLAAAFDMSSELVGRIIRGVTIQSSDSLAAVCKNTDIRIGIITVPPRYAQSVCDSMIGAGIRTIWNFAPVHLTVPKDVYVEHENLAAHLGMLSRYSRSTE